MYADILKPPKPPPPEFIVSVPSAKGEPTIVKVLTSKLPHAPNYLYQCFLLEDGDYKPPFFTLISWPSVEDIRGALAKMTK